MTTTVSKDLAALEQMTIGELHDRYAELFGERIQSRHRIYLVRRIAWRIQANAECGLSERARVRAAQLANPTDVRRTPPKCEGAGDARGGPQGRQDGLPRRRGGPTAIAQGNGDHPGGCKATPAGEGRGHRGSFLRRWKSN